MNIAIIVIPELGGTIRAFLLAKSLLQRGHQISYYGITDFKQDVHRQGLNFVTLFENEYSDGEVDDDPIHEGFFAGLRFVRRKLNRPERKKLLESLIAGEVRSILRKGDIDLVLIDPLFSLDALFFFLPPLLVSSGFKVISLATELISPDWVLPPTTSSFITRGRAIDELWPRFLWVWRRILFYLRSRFWQFVSKLIRL